MAEEVGEVVRKGLLEAAEWVQAQPYVNPVEHVSLGLVGLDVLMASLALVCVLHALSTGRTVLALSILALATVTEQLSIQLGSTHCHTDAVVMVSRCSSLNSILFYLPFLYIPHVVVAGLGVASTYPRAALVGLVQALFGMVYEIQGPSLGWWQYGDGAMFNGAFDDKAFGFPVVAVLFHMAFGAGFALSFALLASFPSVLKLLFAPPLAMVLALIYDVPLRIGAIFGVSRFVSVPLVIFLGFVFPLLVPKWTRQDNSPQGHSPALVAAVLVWHAYFLATPWWDPRAQATLTPDIHAIVAGLTAGSLLFHLAAPGASHKPKGAAKQHQPAHDPRPNPTQKKGKNKKKDN